MHGFMSVTYRILKFVVQSFGLDSVFLTEGSIWTSVMSSGSIFANNYTGPRLSSRGLASDRLFALLVYVR